MLYKTLKWGGLFLYPRLSPENDENYRFVVDAQNSVKHAFSLFLVHRQFILNLTESSFDRIDVPTMPIDKENTLETMPHERHDDITNDDDKCRRLQRDGASKCRCRATKCISGNSFTRKRHYSIPLRKKTPKKPPL